MRGLTFFTFKLLTGFGVDFTHESSPFVLQLGCAISRKCFGHFAKRIQPPCFFVADNSYDKKNKADCIFLTDFFCLQIIKIVY